MKGTGVAMLKINVASGEFVKIGDARLKVVGPNGCRVTCYIDAPIHVRVVREDRTADDRPQVNHALKTA